MKLRELVKVLGEDTVVVFEMDKNFNYVQLAASDELYDFIGDFEKWLDREVGYVRAHERRFFIYLARE